MTSNQNDARRNKLEEDKLNETKRSNRKREKQTDRDLDRKAYEAAHKGLKDAADTIVGFGKLVSNHPIWYNKSKQLVQDVASLSYGEVLGSKSHNFVTMRVNGDDQDENGLNKEFKAGIPGVACIRILNTIPDEKIMTVASKNLYAHVRYANSGSKNYEANDLMMYLLSICEAYQTVAFAHKLYSLSKTYKSESYYYNKAYFKAMGFDAQSFNDNLANFRYKINSWTRRLNAFAIPSDFPIFLRRMFLMLNIFKDESVKRSSNYVFRPEYFYKYAEDTQARLEPLDNVDNMTYSQFCEMVDSIIDAIFDSEDLGIMSGDIMKAYSESQLFKFTEINEDFHIEAVFDADVLTQINGAMPLGDAIQENTTIYTVTTNEGSFIRQGLCDNENELYNQEILFKLLRVNLLNANPMAIPEVDYTILNMYDDSISPDKNMVATRLSATTKGKKLYQDGNYFNHYRKLQFRGTEVVTTVTIAVIENNEIRLNKLWDGFFISNGNLNNSDEAYRTVRDLIRFGWAPKMRFFYLNGSGNLLTPLWDNIDLVNYAFVDPEVLEKMHTVAALSLYNV